MVRLYTKSITHHAIIEDGLELRVRSYDEKRDWARVVALERRCEVGPSHRIFLFTDTLGDPISRIRNSPSYNMLVAEFGEELVGVIQGSVKVVTVDKPPPKHMARVGYILGLRVSPDHRRKGFATALVHSLEQWFASNHVEFSYMATENDNEASVRLFVDRLGYVKFRTPSILVNPVNCRQRLAHCRHGRRFPSRVKIRKLGVESAESLYRRFASSSELFPNDIDQILRNKLNLGTWVAHYKGEEWDDDGIGSAEWRAPGPWAMLSAWNTCRVFKLRLGKAPLSCHLFTRSSRLMDRIFPCFGIPAIPDFFRPFGFYFIYGIHCEGGGELAGELVGALCRFVQELASESKDCKAVVTEVGEMDKVGLYVPHWKSLSCPKDLWFIKSLKSPLDDKGEHLAFFRSSTSALFVDPREV